MMETETGMPLTTFLEKYRNSGTIRVHMPGHKGRSLPEFPALAHLYAWDITEIHGADSLFEAEGILLQGEQRTAAVYGSGACCWSVGGSTLCIQAMLAQMRAEERTVIAVRTVHRAFLNACILLGLEVQWVFPRRGGVISGEYATEDFAQALAGATARGKKPCVYVTSPDYLGNMQDIAALAAACHEHNAPFLVDNAHGAHLAFLSENRHPMALGADYCCDSAHKTLPALTGAAILHCRDAARAADMKRHMQLFGSTSPSYPILQSLEGCTDYLAHEGGEAIRACAQRAAALREALVDKYAFVGTEPLHLTIAADGNDLACQLRERGVECEYADASHIVLLLSPAMTEGDFAGLQRALQDCSPRTPVPVPPLPAQAEIVCDMRTAALSAWVSVPLEEAEGRICGPVQVPCPPAVPICVSGERITRPWLELMRFYGLREAAVLDKKA